MRAIVAVRPAATNQDATKRGFERTNGGIFVRMRSWMEDVTTAGHGLDPAQIEQFISDGFVRVVDAVSYDGTSSPVFS